MPAPISIEVRVRVLDAVDNGMSVSEATRVFQVGQASIYLWRSRRDKLGDCRPLPASNAGRKEALSGYHDRLRKLVAERPDLTLAEIQKELSDEIKVSIMAVSRTLERLGLSLKKRHSTQRSRTVQT